MAKRKKKTDTVDEEAELRFCEHLHLLDLKDWAAYSDWCESHGLSQSKQKSNRLRAAEIELRKREIIAQTRKKARRAKDPATFYAAVCDGELDAADATTRETRAVCEMIVAKRGQAGLMQLIPRVFVAIHRKSRLLGGVAVWGGRRIPFEIGLIRLCERIGQWKRPIEDWRPKSKNRDRQFAELSRHLLADYEVPAFMDSAWFASGEGRSRYRDWFVLIGQGGNIRKENTPISMTKRMAHLFLQAPASYTVDHAFRYGQVHALGGDRRLSDAIVATHLGQSFDNAGFWDSVIRFLIDNPMLDRMHVGPIIDWLNAQRFVEQEHLVGPGQVEIVPPPQPNLSMRGRTVDSVLRDVERWHVELGRVAELAEQFWRRSGISEFNLTTGSTDKNRVEWQIVELLSVDELVREGKEMGNCVASYARSCAAGRCSIWSMRKTTSRGRDFVQTIEISRHRVIVQSRGEYNQMTTPQIRKILGQWALQADLEISSYV